MREDPGYLREILLSFGDHSRESVPDVGGKPCRLRGDTTFWIITIDSAISIGYVALLTWDRMAWLAKELDAKGRPILHTLDHQEPLPRDVEEIFLNPITLGRDLLDIIVAQLCHGLATSSSATGMKVVRSTTHSVTGRPCHQLETPRSCPKDDLMMLFYQLMQGDEIFTYVYGIHNIVDELQRLIQGSSDQRRG